MLPTTRASAGLYLAMTVAVLQCFQAVSACYFPIEFQGTFVTQTQKANNGSSSPTAVTYSEITIEADAVQPWGRCHKRRGNNVILKDISGAEDCMRCFHLSMKTPNVIQLHTEGLELCYITEEAARAKCPSDKDVAERKYTEITLFRKHVPGGLQSIEHVFCPFNGRFRFSYTSSNGELYCNYGYSEMSNCPHGNALNVKFRKCNFPTTDLNFLCLGDWEGTAGGGDRYIALVDLREDPETRPKYRCGLYKEDPLSGSITVSLSSDSTCSTQLHNASLGFESLSMTTTWSQKRTPAQVENSKCRFYDWMQGKWQRTKVEGNQFIYRDEVNNFRTVRSRCMMRDRDSAHDRFLVHSSTQCGETFYSCLWVKRRSPNIMEFKYSDKKISLATNERPNERSLAQLCDDSNFQKAAWITEGKEKIVAQSTPCPIMGDYTGEVPGTVGLCAKVASDCNNPDIMFYSVSSCENRSHVYEEREYRCLGNWEEDGKLYTFTQRRDMPGHQCFAGKVYRNGDEAFIKEAGESCIRGDTEDPIEFGMKIIKQSSCPRLLHPMATNHHHHQASNGHHINNNNNNNNNHNNNRPSWMIPLNTPRQILPVPQVPSSMLPPKHQQQPPKNSMTPLLKPSTSTSVNVGMPHPPINFRPIAPLPKTHGNDPYHYKVNDTFDNNIFTPIVRSPSHRDMKHHHTMHTSSASCLQPVALSLVASLTILLVRL